MVPKCPNICELHQTLFQNGKSYVNRVFNRDEVKESHTSPKLQFFSDVIKSRLNKVNFTRSVSVCTEISRCPSAKCCSSLITSTQRFSSPQLTLAWNYRSPLTIKHLSLPPEPATRTYFCLPSIQGSRKPYTKLD